MAKQQSEGSYFSHVSWVIVASAPNNYEAAAEQYKAVLVISPKMLSL
jgi:hypothetical protein